MHGPAPQILPAETLLLAYRSGIFPMADSRHDEEVYWVEPRERAIIPLEGFRLSSSLTRMVKQDRYQVTCNRAFVDVVAACAASRPGRHDTWINRRIEASYVELHHAGHAHSIECWRDGELVGGLYGVSFDRVFCGESMFSRADNASKVALAWLVALMKRAGYRLLDCQFMTEHLASLGAVALPQAEYLKLLADACADRFAADLPSAHAQLLTSAGAASASGAAGAPASGAAVAEAVGAEDETAVSSPGKLIAQSLTQTS